MRVFICFWIFDNYLLRLIFVVFLMSYLGGVWWELSDEVKLKRFGVKVMCLLYVLMKSLVFFIVFLRRFWRKISLCWMKEVIVVVVLFVRLCVLIDFMMVVIWLSVFLVIVLIWFLIEKVECWCFVLRVKWFVMLLRMKSKYDNWVN